MGHLLLGPGRVLTSHLADQCLQGGRSRWTSVTRCPVPEEAKSLAMPVDQRWVVLSMSGYGSREVVAANERLEGTEMIGEVLGEGLAYQMRNPLPSGVVEALEMIGLAGLLADGLVLDWGPYVFIPHLLIRIKHAVLTVPPGPIRPQPFGALATAIADVKRDD